MQEADAAPLPDLGLDAVLGLELRQELVGLERLAQHVDLALDGGEVPGREGVEGPRDLSRVVPRPEELPLELPSRVRAAPQERERRRPGVPRRPTSTSR